MNYTTNLSLEASIKLILLGIQQSKVLYKNTFWEQGDLISAGYLALKVAMAAYDEEQHPKFEAYIVTCISNALKDMHNKEGYLIRVPRTKDKEGNYLTGYQYCDWEEWLEQGYDQAEESSIVEMIRWMNEMLEESGVTERERMVVEAKYGVGDYEEAWTTQELANELGITTQSVNRVCRRALDKIRVAG